MKEIMWAVLVTSVILKCFEEVDAYSVHLVPSPNATVIEGETLTLNCSCSESNNPAFINWYLNNDTFGLVIKASSCKYQTRPRQYEIHRYNTSCNGTKFSLSIANISKYQDDQDTWKCDTTVRDMVPPQKSSTTIVVIDAGRPDTKNRQHDTPKTELEVAVVVVCVIAAITFFAVIITVRCFLHRKRKNDHLNKINKDHHEVHLADFHEVHHEDYDDDHTQM